MDGYLLDVNALHDWFHKHAVMRARIETLDKRCPVMVSAITLGELEFGHNIHLAGRDLANRDEFDNWVIRQFPEARVLVVDRHSRITYGKIRAKIFEK